MPPAVIDKILFRSKMVKPLSTLEVGVSETYEESEDHFHKNCANAEETAKEQDTLQSSLPLKRKKRCTQALRHKWKRKTHEK